MNEYLLWLIGLLIIINIVINLLKNKNSNPNTYDQETHKQYNEEIKKKVEDQVENLRTAFTNSLSTVNTTVGQNKGIIESRSEEILEAHRRLVDSITGSKRSGIAGELLLESLFKSSGLVENKQWLKNQSIEKDGTTLSVEYGIKHPTGLVLPIDAHWTKDLYEQLLKLREETASVEVDKKKEDLYKKIIKSYKDKAIEVNKKYIDSPISAGFACVYVPSESLYLEINTHINADKELLISEIQREYKVTFMGPSTFSAYCNSILLGFNSIAVDQKAKSFLKNLASLNTLIKNHFAITETHENNMRRAFDSASSLSSTAEKIKNKTEKVEQELHEIDRKDEN